MSHPFKDAVLAGDHAAMVATLAPGVQFHSPVAFRPFDGRESTAGVLAAIMSVFEDFEWLPIRNFADAVGYSCNAIFEVSLPSGDIDGLMPFVV